MRIAASALQFNAQYERVERRQVTETLRVWNTPEPAPQASESGDTPSAETLVDTKLLLLMLFIERLTGRKLKLFDAKELAKLQEEGATGASNGPNWGAVYNREEIEYESEQSQFTATGLVRTADGQEIQFNLALTMSREFMNRTGIQVRAGAALKDPLVINFNGAAAELSGKSMSFDLMANGTKGMLPLLGANSAYLAWDRNGDGKINDGRELFGPTTSNGFTELATLDSDGNGWIDEGDPLFAQLRLWTRDNDDHDQLVALKDRGIGALSLAALATPFDLKVGDQLTGQVRTTGVYLSEDGSAGTVQQIDVSA